MSVYLIDCSRFAEKVAAKKRTVKLYGNVYGNVYGKRMRFAFVRFAHVAVSSQFGKYTEWLPNENDTGERSSSASIVHSDFSEVIAKREMCLGSA